MLDSILNQGALDRTWIDQNASTLLTAIEDKRDDKRAVDAILRICPYILERHDLKRWGKLLKDILKRSEVEVVEGEDRWQTYNTGQAYVLSNQKPQPRPTKRRRYRERPDSREMLSAYLSLLILRAYRPGFDRATLNAALDFARQVNHTYLYYKTYQALALVCTRLGEFDRALDYAQLAYAYWNAESSDPRIILERALSAYALSSAYHGLGMLEQAQQWLEVAADLFSKVRYPLQYGIIARQRGLLHITMGQCEAAQQWLRLALEEFNRLDATLHIAVTQHYMGMLWACLDELDKATEHLLWAMTLFEQLGDVMQQQHVQTTLAYVEARQGLQAQALARLKEMGGSTTLIDAIENDQPGSVSTLALRMFNI